MEEELRSIEFVSEDGSVEELYVLEEATLQNVHYLLVAEELEEDSEEVFVRILKQIGEEEEFQQYEEVVEDEELAIILKLFDDLMDDVDFED